MVEKRLTEEEIAERTKKKLEEDEKSSEAVKEQLKTESEKAAKEAEAQAKADKEFEEEQKKKAAGETGAQGSTHGGAAPAQEGAHPRTGAKR